MIEDLDHGASFPDSQDQSPRLAGVVDRVKASIADSVMLILLMIGVTNIFSQVESDIMRIGTFCMIALLYEPLMVSLLGATIGHFLAGIRVRSISDRNKKI